MLHAQRLEEDKQLKSDEPLTAVANDVVEVDKNPGASKRPIKPPKSAFRLNITTK